MEFNNFPYLLEPDKSVSLITSLLFIFAAIALSTHYFLKFKSQNKDNEKTSWKDISQFIIFQPGVAFIVVALLAVNSLKDEKVHQYEISPKYFTIKDRYVQYTVEPYPEGKRKERDVMSASLFIQKIESRFFEGKNICHIRLQEIRNQNIIEFSSSLKNCEDTSKAIFEKINLSKMNDYKNIKNLKPIEYQFMSIKEEK